VNQLLAKMDGVAPLVVPTLVIGLTNRRSLIDSALLRPGRFEVQIEVPPPRTVEQRVSILNVHLRHMQRSGRLRVRDAPQNSVAASMIADDSPTYMELLLQLANSCDGFSAASLAGVARAAASHALERAVEEVSCSSSHSILQCVVTMKDFSSATADIRNGLGDSDWSEEEESAPKEVDQDQDSQ
jgi:vesicle-fusing ATPase